MKSTTKKIAGTVHHVDLEGGYYTLRTDKGEIYKLEGGAKDLLEAGVRAEVEGEVDDKAFSIFYGTPILKVKGHRVIAK